MTKFGRVIKDHKLATKTVFWSLICKFWSFFGHLYLIVWSRISQFLVILYAKFGQSHLLVTNLVIFSHFMCVHYILVVLMVSTTNQYKILV